jgi:CDP-4-dehydro-6-deoxyglucose reductase
MVNVTEYQVQILPGGPTLRARAGETLLAAAYKAGLDITSSCRLGYCGACRARLHAGAIAYPSGQIIEPPQGDADAGEIMLCIARPRSDLTIEPLWYRS